MSEARAWVLAGAVRGVPANVRYKAIDARFGTHPRSLVALRLDRVGALLGVDLRGERLAERLRDRLAVKVALSFEPDGKGGEKALLRVSWTGARLAELPGLDVLRQGLTARPDTP